MSRRSCSWSALEDGKSQNKPPRVRASKRKAWVALSDYGRQKHHKIFENVSEIRLDSCSLTCGVCQVLPLPVGCAHHPHREGVGPERRLRGGLAAQCSRHGKSLSDPSWDVGLPTMVAHRVWAVPVAQWTAGGMQIVPRLYPESPPKKQSPKKLVRIKLALSVLCPSPPPKQSLKKPLPNSHHVS